MAELPPGRYEPEIEGYSGHIQFPHPMRLPHFKGWWEHAVEPILSKKRLDWDSLDFEWQGAKHLLLEYGKWSVEGEHCKPGDARNDDVPLEIWSWVIECADDFIYPQLPPKKLVRLSSLT
jgi:hypothetical protein